MLIPSLSSKRSAGPESPLLDQNVFSEETDMSPAPPALALPHRDTTPLRIHAGGDVHTRQLLEKQLGRVRNMDLRNLRFVLARPALELILLEAPVRNIISITPFASRYSQKAARARALTQ